MSSHETLDETTDNTNMYIWQRGYSNCVVYVHSYCGFFGVDDLCTSLTKIHYVTMHQHVLKLTTDDIAYLIIFNQDFV